jgi:phage baseplate assembly protein W
LKINRVDPKTGKIQTVAHEEDIAEAVSIIIGTQRGERVMRPDFGSTANSYVFAPSTHSQKDALSYDIREQLLLQEPRIIDVEVSCREENGATGTLVVNVAYTVRSTNNRYNRVYPFFTDGGELL